MIVESMQSWRALFVVSGALLFARDSRLCISALEWVSILLIPITLGSGVSISHSVLALMVAFAIHCYLGLYWHIHALRYLAIWSLWMLADVLCVAVELSLKALARSRWHPGDTAGPTSGARAALAGEAPAAAAEEAEQEAAPAATTEEAEPVVAPAPAGEEVKPAEAPEAAVEEAKPDGAPAGATQLFYIGDYCEEYVPTEAARDADLSGDSGDDTELDNQRGTAACQEEKEEEAKWLRPAERSCKSGSETGSTTTSRGSPRQVIVAPPVGSTPMSQARAALSCRFLPAPPLRSPPSPP